MLYHYIMKLFKKKERVLKVSSDFKKNTQKAINLLLNSDNYLTDEMILDLFQKNGINKIDSIEILLFLPVAFMRKLYDHLKWHDTYMELDDENNQVEKRYADHLPYRIIWQETEEYFRNLPVSKDILKIAGRSAEFNGLNSILLQNPEMKAEDIILSNIFIVR